MPKLKTNSSAKKRFKITGSGKVAHKQAGKRHGMTKKSKVQISKLRKGAILSDAHGKGVIKFLMPYGD
jgi:large subunit ribosomal protein L35